MSTTTCTSTCESELGSANIASKEIEAKRALLNEVFSDCLSYVVQTSLLHGDNSAANLIASSSAGLRSVRHIALTEFYVRSLSQKGHVQFRSVPSQKNYSDLLTKVLHEDILSALCDLFGCHRLP